MLIFNEPSELIENRTFREDVEVHAQSVRMRNCSFHNCRLSIARGQEASYRDLGFYGQAAGLRLECGSFKNMQVTRTVFDNIICQSCDIGFAINLGAKVARSWANANTFVNCSARDCRIGWLTVGPEPIESGEENGANYNNFSGGSSERNGTLLDMPHASACTWTGCHMVSAKPTIETVRIGRSGLIVGGRWVVKVSLQMRQV